MHSSRTAETHGLRSRREVFAQQADHHDVVVLTLGVERPTSTTLDHETELLVECEGGLVERVDVALTPLVSELHEVEPEQEGDRLVADPLAAVWREQSDAVREHAVPAISPPDADAARHVSCTRLDDQEGCVVIAHPVHELFEPLAGHLDRTWQVRLPRSTLTVGVPVPMKHVEIVHRRRAQPDELAGEPVHLPVVVHEVILALGQRRATGSSAHAGRHTLPRMDLGWTIDIDAAGDPADAGEGFDERLAAFERALEPYGGAVAGSQEIGRFGARFSLDTTSVNPVEVLEEGLLIFHDAAVDAELPAWQVVRCEILTYEEDQATEADEATEEP
jgi:hypothetical protein